MQQKIVYTSGIKTTEQANKMEIILKEMIGVYDANVDLSNGHISVEFETPANLNSIEKEIYDSGFKVLY